MYDEALKVLSAWPVIQGAVALLLVLYGVKSMRKGEAQAVRSPYEPDVPGWVYRLSIDDCVQSVRQGQVTAEHNNRLQQDILAVLVDIRDELRRHNPRN